MCKKYYRGSGLIHPIDAYAGEQLRKLRKLKGISQTALAEDLGLTFQQVQKYERGKNRISASKLHEIANLFDTPITYFFPDDINNTLVATMMDEMTAMAETFAQMQTQLKEANKTIKRWQKIKEKVESDG